MLNKRSRYDDLGVWITPLPFLVLALVKLKEKRSTEEKNAY